MTPRIADTVAISLSTSSARMGPLSVTDPFDAADIAALLPVRYPGSETDADGAIRLARKTEWQEVSAKTFHGRGQRMLATDVEEYSLLNVREIKLSGA